MAIKALINRFNGFRGHGKDSKDAPPPPMKEVKPGPHTRQAADTQPAPALPALVPLDTALNTITGFTGPPSSGPNSAGPSPKLPHSDPGNNRQSRSKASAPTAVDHGTKRVAFISPPQTPGLMPIRSLPEGADADDVRRKASADPVRPSDVPPRAGVPKTQRTYSNPHQPDTRQSTSTQTTFSSVPRNGGRFIPSRQGVASPTLSARPATAGATAPDQLAFSLRSGTPYSHMSGRSFVPPAASWSEAAEEDLVSNIGPRERTRQEVLWEIVTSEERYVEELLKMKQTFLDPLLHPFAMSPLNSPAIPESDGEDAVYRPPGSPHESLDHLPIAARFLSPTPILEGDLEAAPSSEEGDLFPSAPPDFKRSTVTSSHQRSPYGQTVGPSRGGRGKAVPFPSRSHQSLPAPPRTNAAASTVSLGRGSPHGDQRAPTSQDSHGNRAGASTPGSRVLRKLQKRSGSDADVSKGISPQALPEDLRECLQVLEQGILGGHIILAEGLRKRYEEQLPLVRSLADVFVAHSNILREYATYVLHLERALEQVDSLLSTDVSKKPKKQDAVEWTRVSRIIQRLEEAAADKGETGLAICLSKPFQRLLKYPLLFQNLLFHTDPSTYEYESTLLMVAEVETIVRSIEDEKIQKEERDKTRDVFARIDGLDKVKGLAAPKSSRMLVEERLLMDSGPADGSPSPKPASQPPAKVVKQKSSFRRLSDVLQPGSHGGVGGKKDLWLVVFNDVALRCQRTGVTTLPLASSSSRSASAPELQKSGKYATTGKRNSHNRPRNMYKFLKVETWAIGEVAQPRGGVVSMEDIDRTRAQLTEANLLSVEQDEDEGMESDESDRKSKMSFSYWGADKITVQRSTLPGNRGGQRGTAARPMPGSSNIRESSANAKFGSRLRTSEGPPVTRPMSRQTPQRRVTNGSDDTAKSSRPAWNATTAASRGIPPAAVKRGQNTALSAAPLPTRTTKSSTAPSEDSGVGLYRQILAANPSINKL